MRTNVLGLCILGAMLLIGAARADPNYCGYQCQQDIAAGRYNPDYNRHQLQQQQQRFDEQLRRQQRQFNQMLEEQRQREDQPRPSYDGFGRPLTW